MRRVAVLLSLTLIAPAAAQAPTEENPCLGPKRARLLCPDLRMARPFGLKVDRTTRRGRVLLRAGNAIDNIGNGPAELFGRRIGRLTMRAAQRIRTKAGRRIPVQTGAHLTFKFVRGQGRIWKFQHAARFELFSLDSGGRRVRRVRTGPKIAYCLRDLAHRNAQLRRSPSARVYPACRKRSSLRQVRLGTSVGWSDVYPPGYPEQWIDVTGLRGCFAYVHTADPRNGLWESNEGNNVATVVVRLPYRRGRQRCPRALDAQPAPEAPGEYGGY